jgi:8-oxo-dGTP pyrophosphatase MutT (NUDIX family)
VRTDVVEVHIFRAKASADGSDAGWELLQLRRVEQPMAGTWQPVMGHIEVGEAATAAALRELAEEVGLRPGDAGLVGVWRLEQSVPYYIARSDAFMISPRFAVEVTADWSPTLNDEHDGMRWIGTDQLQTHVFWPSQRAAIAELLTEIAGDGGPAKAALLVEV